MTDIEEAGPNRPRHALLPPSTDTVIWRFAPLALGLGAALALSADALWPAEMGPARVALPLAAFALVAGAAGLGLARAYPHGRVGACNAVTLGRAALLSLLVAPLAAPGALADPALAWTAFSVAAIALALDGIDGWLARRSGLASGFGARFDMEVDSGLALLLALLAWRTGTVGPWVLLLGGMRYLYGAATLALPWLRPGAPERWSRKAAAVVQIAALIALLAPPVAPPWSTAAGLGALAALLWSFAVDVAWLWRRRAA